MTEREEIIARQMGLGVVKEVFGPALWYMGQSVQEASEEELKELSRLATAIMGPLAGQRIETGVLALLVALGFIIGDVAGLRPIDLMPTPEEIERLASDLTKPNE